MNRTTIGDVIDVLTARIEQSTDPAERAALDRALDEIESYVAREERIVSLVGRAVRLVAWRQKEANR